MWSTDTLEEDPIGPWDTIWRRGEFSLDPIPLSKTIVFRSVIL